MEAIRDEFDLAGPFPRAVQREARRAAGLDFAAQTGRLDLSRLTTLTIDPADARDHDDAISLEPRPDGGCRLGVHIADVAEYVAEGSQLDREAFRRGNSTYFYLDTIPMLPGVLSGEQCSLNDRELRPAVSVLIDYDARGAVVATTFAESLVRVDHGLSYERAEALLAEEESGEPAGLLRRMLALAQKLGAERRDGGGLHFELPETVPVDEGDGVERFADAPILRSHGIVEEFMLAANHAVGRLLRERGIPHLTRVHEPPDPEDVEELIHQMMRHRIDWRPGDAPTGRDYQRLAARISERENARRLLFRMLRSMKKAGYSETDHGHFGLGWRDYLHFTSPIRRYADLMTHRLLKDLIAARAREGDGGRVFTVAGGRTREGARPGRDRRDYGALFAGDGQRRRRRSLRDVAAAINERELLSLKAERESLKLEMVLWARRHMGERFRARVLEVMPTGLLLRLPASGAEGFVPAQFLGDEYWQWREEREELRGERTGKTYEAGAELTVTIVGANLFSRRTQFLLEEDRQSNDTISNGYEP